MDQAALQRSLPRLVLYNMYGDTTLGAHVEVEVQENDAPSSPSTSGILPKEIKRPKSDRPTPSYSPPLQPV